MNKVIRENIYRDILELSNIDNQKLSWLNGDKNRSSSYVEVMCRLFDDNDFEGFIEEVSYLKETTFINELNLLKELLNQYNGDYKDDLQIITDPNWLKIVEQAKNVVLLWRNIKW